MTCGIYKLKFLGTDKVYIGQSDNIERRYTEHLAKARQGTWSTKLQEAYTLYGEPTVEVLLECDRSELDMLENEAIDIYSSYTNGYNTLEHAKDTPLFRGTSHPNAKYSKEDVVRVATLLQDATLEYATISSITGMSTANIRNIAGLTAHNWLNSEYPDLYSGLVKLKGTRRQTRYLGVSASKYSNVISPQGLVYTVGSLTKFAETHGLSRTGLQNMLAGRSKSHKGWRCTTDI